MVSLILLPLVLLLGATASDGQKMLIGYFGGLYKYDPHGANYPLPSNVTNALQLLEQEMGPIIPLYDVIIQAFIAPSDYVDGQIIDDPAVAAVRDGVDGAKGLMQLCRENGVSLAISIGGGGAPRFIPEDPSEFPALVNALYKYVVQYNYSGIDIDEENAVDVETYTAFIQALGERFRPVGLTVSLTVGPLSCCYESRGVCTLGPYVDWVFLMLYDGLTNSASFDVEPASSFIWQATDGQTYCNITTNSSSQYGFVGNVATGACQFINFALYLHWPADKLIMGLPSYSYPSVMAWFQFPEQNIAPVTDDQTALLTQYENGLYIPSASDIASRCSYVLDPSQSVLGVTLLNSGWQSRIVECSARGTYAGATILGAGFWHIGLEDNLHHELSYAARTAIDGINDRFY